jgi:hypothetical protein
MAGHPLPQPKSAADQGIIRQYRPQRGFIGHHGNDTTIKRHLTARAVEKRGPQQRGKRPARHAASTSRGVARIGPRHKSEDGGHFGSRDIAFDQYRVLGAGFVKPPKDHRHTCID